MADGPALVINPGLSIEPLGNLLQLHVTGPDPTDREVWDWSDPASMAWRTKPPRTVTIRHTLSVDDALDLRDGLSSWVASLGVAD